MKKHLIVSCVALLVSGVSQDAVSQDATAVSGNSNPLVFAVHGMGAGNRADGWSKEMANAWKIGQVTEVTFRTEFHDGASYVDALYQAGAWAREVQKQIESTIARNPGRPIIIVSHSWGTVATALALKGGIGGGEVLTPMDLGRGRVKEWMTLGSPLGMDLSKGGVSISPGRPFSVDHWTNVYDVKDPVSTYSHDLGGADNIEVSGSGRLAGWLDPTGLIGAHANIWTNLAVTRLLREAVDALDDAAALAAGMKAAAVPVPAKPVAASPVTPVPTADDDLAQAKADADAIAAEAKKKRDKKKADDAAAKLAAARKGPVKTEPPPPPPDDRDPVPPKAPTRAQGRAWDALRQQGQEDARRKAEADAAQRRADEERQRIAREDAQRRADADEQRIAREQDEWRRRAEARDQADQDARRRAEADARAQAQAAAEAEAWARETARLADEVAKQKELEARTGAATGRRGPSMDPSAADMLIRERFRAKFGRDMTAAEHQALIDALGWKPGDEITQVLLDKAFGLIAGYSGSLPSSGGGGGGGTPPATPSSSTKAAAVAKCEADYQSAAAVIRAQTQWNIAGYSSQSNGCYAAETVFTACYEKGCTVLRSSGIHNDCTKKCTDSFISACKDENLADFAAQRDQCVARAK